MAREGSDVMNESIHLLNFYDHVVLYSEHFHIVLKKGSFS